MAQKFKDRVLAGSGFSNKKFTSDYGEKLMKQMGWNGDGLGLKQDGTTECIQIKRRNENEGLGNDNKKAFKWNDNWWDNTYASAMSNLNVGGDQDSDVSESSASSVGVIAGIGGGKRKANASKFKSKPTRKQSNVSIASVGSNVETRSQTKKRKMSEISDVSEVVIKNKKSEKSKKNKRKLSQISDKSDQIKVKKEKKSKKIKK